MSRPPSRRFSNRGQEEPDARIELRSGTFERWTTGTLGGSFERRIRDAPVHQVRMGGEFGADLANPVAQRDHEIETMRHELVKMLGSVGADVNAALLHHPYGVRMKRLRVAASAKGAED